MHSSQNSTCHVVQTGATKEEKKMNVVLQILVVVCLISTLLAALKQIAILAGLIIAFLVLLSILNYSIR
jgi:hypothetical protein